MDRRALRHGGDATGELLAQSSSGSALRDRDPRREDKVLAQLYLLRFEFRCAPSKAEFDQAWDVTLQRFARCANWDGAEAGVRLVKTYGTAWGRYALIEVDDPETFAPYEADHIANYPHKARITIERIFEVNTSFAQRMGQIA